MSVEHVEFLVEEQSMAELLQILLPELLGGVSYAVHQLQSKQDLLDKLPARLAGYARWIPDGYRIVVIIDRDNEDCEQLKGQLEAVARQAGLSTRSSPVGGKWVVVNRIAIEELEAWYFGDWKAVRAAYPRVSATVPSHEPYRNPDSIAGGTWEAFERELQKAGYMKNRLRKVEAAREIGRHMRVRRNTSKSFRALCAVLSEMASP